jgi:hypothetical protein
VDLRADQQVALLAEFARFMPEMPFKDQASDGLRFGSRTRISATAMAPCCTGCFDNSGLGASSKSDPGTRRL